VKILLDTCAVLWSVLDPRLLSKAAVDVLTEESTEVFVSTISCAEIACGVERARVRLDRHWRLWFRHFIQLNGWQVLDIGLGQIEEAYSLPEYSHRDPADRIIIGTARLLQCPIVTGDRRILEYPHVQKIW